MACNCVNVTQCISSCRRLTSVSTPFQLTKNASGRRKHAFVCETRGSISHGCCFCLPCSGAWASVAEACCNAHMKQEHVACYLSLRTMPMQGIAPYGWAMKRISGPVCCRPYSSAIIGRAKLGAKRHIDSSTHLGRSHQLSRWLHQCGHSPLCRKKKPPRPRN